MRRREWSGGIDGAGTDVFLEAVKEGLEALQPVAGSKKAGALELDDSLESEPQQRIRAVRQGASDV